MIDITRVIDRVIDRLHPKVFRCNSLDSKYVTSFLERITSWEICFIYNPNIGTKILFESLVPIVKSIQLLNLFTFVLIVVP